MRFYTANNGPIVEHQGGAGSVDPNAGGPIVEHQGGAGSVDPNAGGPIVEHQGGAGSVDPNKYGGTARFIQDLLRRDAVRRQAEALQLWALAGQVEGQDGTSNAIRALLLSAARKVARGASFGSDD